MTRTTTTHPRGELEEPGVWQTLGKKKGKKGGKKGGLESGTLWGKKKKKKSIYIHIHTHSWWYI
jgi:hypothetical protein